MTVVFPEFVSQYGNTSVLVIQSLTAPGAISLAGDVNDATTVNVSCFLYGGGVGTETTNKVTRPRRLCTTREFQSFGSTTYEVTDLSYGYNPQEDDTDDANAMKAALTPGTKVVIAVRKGLDAEDAAYAASQVVDLWYVELGPQNRGVTGDGEGDEYAINQPLTVYREPDYDVVIAS